MTSKSKEAFRDIIRKRGEVLRQLDFDQLKTKISEPTETISVNGRQATVSTIIELRLDGRVLVVVQGFLKAFAGAHVELDGFFKSSDGTIGDVPDDVFYEFD